MKRSFLLFAAALSALLLAVPKQVHALSLLGTGTAALRGGQDVGGVVQIDLTDPTNAADKNAYNLHTGGSNTGGFRGVFFSSDEPGFNGGEFAFNVFDNTVGGGNAKWCCGTSFPQIVGATLPQQHVLSSFTITSGNDTPGRDPVVWRMEGSNDGSNFTTIYSGSAVWTARNQVALFESGVDYTAPSAYNTFRMVTDQTGLVGGAFFQINEIELFDNAFSASFVPPAGVDVNVGRLRDGLGKPSTQSSTLGGFTSNLALDGNLGNFTHTLNSDTNPTWEVDLGATVPISTIEVNNRGGGCCQSRLRDITVSVLDFNGNEVFNSGLLNEDNFLGGKTTAGPASLTVDLAALAGGPIKGRRVVVTRTPDDDLSGSGGVGNADEGRVLSMGEVQIHALNVALNPRATVTQSSTLGGFAASNGINNDLEDFTHTLNSDTNPTWKIDLGEELLLDSVIIHNRGDGCCQSRLRDITVEVLDKNGNTVFVSDLLNPENDLFNRTTDGPLFLAVDLLELTGGSVLGQSVVVRRTIDDDLSGTMGIGNADEGRVLSFGEIQIFGSRQVIPEPATASLALLGLTALGLRRRRHRA